MTLLTAVNSMLAVMTVAGQAFFLVLLAALIGRRERIVNVAGAHALWWAFLVALGATLGRLFYSEIAGYEPCKLCWFQRIFLYPQTILLGIALWKKDPGIARYIFALSVIGAVIAGYHYLLQIGVAPELPCAAVGYSVSCSQRFVLQFGYITIPLMAFTAFLLNAILAFAHRRSSAPGIRVR